MKKINIHKKIKQFILSCFVICLCLPFNVFATTTTITPTLKLTPTITITPTPTPITHTHSPSCYVGTKHVHSNSCYVDANIGGCGGTLTWQETGEGSGTCPYCNGTYTCTYYTGTCASCGKTYTDTIYDACATCGVTIKPIQSGTSYPRYQSTKCKYQIDGESLMVLSCGKEEGKYYLQDGTLDSPICSKVAISIKAVKETQSGTSVDCTLQVTYLDGHVGIVTGTSNFDPLKNYSSSIVTLTYNGLVGNAQTNSSLSTNIKMTTPYKTTTTPTPTISGVITTVVTQTPTLIITPKPTPIINNNSNNNQTQGNKFSSSKNTRGNNVSTLKNNNDKENIENQDINVKTEEREAVSVKIKRPLTTKEKLEKIDGSMTLTKLYRNEENDLVGKILENNSEKKAIVETGNVNKGQVAPQKEDFIIIFMFFVIIAIIIVFVGIFFFMKKRKEEKNDVKHINLKNSLGL